MTREAKYSAVHFASSIRIPKDSDSLHLRSEEASGAVGATFRASVSSHGAGSSHFLRSFLVSGPFHLLFTPLAPCWYNLHRMMPNIRQTEVNLTLSHGTLIRLQSSDYLISMPNSSGRVSPPFSPPSYHPCSEFLLPASTASLRLGLMASSSYWRHR